MANSIKGLKKNYFVGKNVIITGATGGFGSLLSEKYWELGCNLLLLARNEKKLIALIDRLNKKKSDIQKINKLIIDFKNNLNKKEIINAIDKFGLIDILINNAAIHGPIGNFWENNLSERRNRKSITKTFCFYHIRGCF